MQSKAVKSNIRGQRYREQLALARNFNVTAVPIAEITTKNRAGPSLASVRAFPDRPSPLKSENPGSFLPNASVLPAIITSTETAHFMHSGCSHPKLASLFNPLVRRFLALSLSFLSLPDQSTSWRLGSFTVRLPDLMIDPKTSRCCSF